MADTGDESCRCFFLPKRNATITLMHNNFDHLRTLTHHAYLFIGAKVHEIIEFLEHHHKIKIQGNPDFSHQTFQTFTIDDSRALKELHASKSFSADSKRIFVIEFFNITPEAQNALLKIFEEPHENTHFFLIAPSAHILLPTLRSRLFHVDGETFEIDTVEAQKFLKLSPKDRVTFVDGLAEDVSDEKLTKADVQKFLTELEVELHAQGEYEKLKAVLKARDYLGDRSSSVKQLLEYVALNM
ncbi:MAG: hypothetical protein V4697_01735 [Patescibacteria group bacterium]